MQEGLPPTSTPSLTTPLPNTHPRPILFRPALWICLSHYPYLLLYLYPLNHSPPLLGVLHLLLPNTTKGVHGPLYAVLKSDKDMNFWPGSPHNDRPASKMTYSGFPQYILGATMGSCSVLPSGMKSVTSRRTRGGNDFTNQYYKLATKSHNSSELHPKRRIHFLSSTASTLRDPEVTRIFNAAHVNYSSNNLKGTV